jgi:hypothetical protein
MQRCHRGTRRDSALRCDPDARLRPSALNGRCGCSSHRLHSMCRAGCTEVLHAWIPSVGAFPGLHDRSCGSGVACSFQAAPTMELLRLQRRAC